MRPTRPELIQSRVTPEERAAIQANADAAGLTVSSYLRECAMRRPVKSTVDVRMLALLNKLGGMVKQLWKEGRGHEAGAIERGLDGIRDAITRAQAQAGGRR